MEKSNEPDSYGNTVGDESESPEGSTIEALTYYPDLKRSKRKTAGEPPKRFGFNEHACVVLDPHQSKDNLPTTYDEAIGRADSAKWLEAMRLEFNSLTDMGTWELVQLPPGRKVIETKWVFDLKLGGKGEILRHKARIVAKGFSQIFGIDFYEVFAPVSRYATVRFIISVSVEFGWKRIIIDVKNAFVNAPLEEEIYIDQPAGFIKKHKEDYVYRLHKALYGLRQASREWNRYLDRFLKNIGCVPSEADPTLYVLKREEYFVLLVVYVDDILLVSNSERGFEEIIWHFEKRFEIRIMKVVEKFLGFTVEDNGETVKIHNAPMVERLLNHFKMRDCKGASTPLACGVNLSHDESDVLAEATPYRQLVGSLLHLSNTVRPDICYATGYLSRYMHNPTNALWKAAKRVLRYLKQTPTMGLVYQISKDRKVISTFADADWGQEKPSRKSISGNVVLFGGALVNWRSKQQSIVALSSKEAEYISLASCIQDVIWFKKFETTLGMVMDEKVVRELFNISIGEDNQSCISDAKSPVLSSYSKHVDIKYRYLVQNIENGNIGIHYVPTDEMIADAFTKNLTNSKFNQFVKMMGLEK